MRKYGRHRCKRASSFFMFYFLFAGATDGADAGDPRPAQRAGLTARGAAPSLARAAGALGQAGEELVGK